MIPTESTTRAQLEAMLLGEFAEMKIHVPSNQTDLIDEGILDSLTFVELVYRLEAKHGIKVPIETIEADDFRTIAHIAGVIERERAA